MWYRVPDTCGVAILDASALQGWGRAQIESLSKHYRLAILDCLLGEVLLKGHAKAQKLLRKLVGIQCVLVRDIGAHCAWEVAHGEPVGLLLIDDLKRGFPEQTAQLAIVSVCSCSALRHQRFSDNFQATVDRPHELRWEDLHQRVLAVHESTQAAVNVRRAGRAAFLDAWPAALSSLRDKLLPYFEGFLDGFRDHASSSVDAAVMMNDDCVVYRLFIGLLTYMHANVVANPSTFSHERLNQRLDLHYVALTGKGMCLVTRDHEMKEIVPIVSPQSRVISDASEIPE